MPAIRDGRRQLHVHDMSALPVNPPGPVERSRVSEARMADFEAERAAGPSREGRLRKDGATFTPSIAERERAAESGRTTQRKQREAAPAPTKPKGPPKGFKRSPETRERMRQAQLARYAAQREGLANALAEPPPEPQDIAPLDPIVTAPALALSYPPGEIRVSVEGEDRCGFGVWLGATFLSVCDRPTGHVGEHRGRLFRVGVTAGTCEQFGHVAVPA